ncbi:MULTISPECIES: type II toxin-antitoxin system RelE/ParE family toxin [Nostocales]|uniref:Plasmid stabilization protein n=3 Tax=Nostocales TaxID=1161 RepID=A0A0C1N6U0_9CYAN|nr:type II toxin-antitoxin system RelE/ParE family toxin [Tolypothrix bouteillei]KAF3886378.1 type II toxin-antitoxin system RelE/ParE family toxin [Tolypothrix bouteillei VB521301]
MAYRVVWSPKALDDVDAIAAYIFRDSASYAATVVQRILDSSRKLSKLPLSGPIVPEFNDGSIRELFAYTYRIIYQIQGNTVTIAAVIHGKRLLAQAHLETD